MSPAFRYGRGDALLYEDGIDILVFDIRKDAKRYLRFPIKITAGQELSLPVGYVDYRTVFKFVVFSRVRDIAFIYPEIPRLQAFLCSLVYSYRCFQWMIFLSFP